MRYLVVMPQLGFTSSGDIVPGGLLQFGRCLVRAMASFPAISQLSIWSQVDPPEAEIFIQKMVRVHSHANLSLDVRCYGGNRLRFSLDIASANWAHKVHRVMYVLVNQAVLALLPGHLPYSIWEIGAELFMPVSFLKYQALHRAQTLLSISHNTAQVVAQHSPELLPGQVVHLCLEPPFYGPDPDDDPVATEPFLPAQRDCAVLIVGNVWKSKMYKGHQQLIAAWSEVVGSCAQAELWIAGGGDGQPELERQAAALSLPVARQIHFLGHINDGELQARYRRCRVFAMPSTGEGFGLVFVEAARYGVPGIGGKHDSVKEIVLDRQTGLLVEQSPHDIALACIELLSNDALAARLGEAARQRYLSNFRYRHFRQRLLQALDLEI